MDTGNNRHHCFKSSHYFPCGTRPLTLRITGVHGPKLVPVGIGTAYFTTISNTGTTHRWVVPHSILNTASPVNLFCHDRFHFDNSGRKTGDKVDFLEETLTLKDGTVIPVTRDTVSHLPLVTIAPFTPHDHQAITARNPTITTAVRQQMSYFSILNKLHTLSLFKHTELQPLTTFNAWRIMGCPLEKYFNKTIQHNMLDGMQGVSTLKSVAKGNRPSMWYAGKMTHRTVPHISRKPASVRYTPGSHIVSDIGYVSMPDREGHKYFVLFKDMCTQYRTVYRMKEKSDIVDVWRRFIADHQLQSVSGSMSCSIKYLVTDADQSYIAGKVKEANIQHLIGKYTLSPYNHQANPSESEMRRVMEGAVSHLYDSGLPPSFLLDALVYHVESVNRLYTPIHHRACDEFKTPYERKHGSKPALSDIARFGCKTYVYVPKQDRKKHDAHMWIGFYLGPSHQMRACRVYRPLKHAVYNRYHTLHDCDIVFGDVMGAEYRKRVETDKAQRQYFNQEVKSILQTPSPKDWVHELLRAVPWSPQPLPAPPSASPTQSHPSPTPNVSQAHTTPPLRRSKRSRPSLSPPLESSHSRARTTTPLMHGIKHDTMRNLLSIVDVTCQYMSLVEEYQALDDTLTDDALKLISAASVQDSHHYSLIQLCEKTSRALARKTEPKTFRGIEKLEGVEEHLVREAMLEEVKWMIDHNKCLPRDRRTLPQDINEIDGKWVIKYKKTLDNMLERVRARWVLRGDTQIPHVDFNPRDIYSPVASKSATLTILALAAQFGLHLHCLDVSKAFTVSDIEPGVFVKVPRGFHDQPHPDFTPYGKHTTWELLTTLYGLKQASAKYYHTFASVLLAYTDANGDKFRRSAHDPCVFTKGALGSDSYITFSIHIDDKFIACTGEHELLELQSILDKANFKYRVEPMTQVLGMKVSYTPYQAHVPQSGTVTIDHSQFITDAFNFFKKKFTITSPINVPMQPQAYKDVTNDPDPHPTFNKERYTLFRSILGKVSHIANFTHPEISTAVSLVSQKMANPSQRDLSHVWDILRYLHGTVTSRDPKRSHVYTVFTISRNPNFSLRSTHSQHPIHICCDADLSNDIATRRSRTGYCAYLFGNLVGWCSRRQPSVSLSTAESEYMAISASAQFGKWYKGLVSDMGLEMAAYEPIVILTDSRSAQNIANSHIAQVNKYSKHISQRVHWFRELIRDGVIRVNHTPGDENPADIFTKILGKVKFRKCRDSLLNGDKRQIREITGLTCISQFFHCLPNIDSTQPWTCNECTCHDAHFNVISMTHTHFK